MIPAAHVLFWGSFFLSAAHSFLFSLFCDRGLNSRETNERETIVIIITSIILIITTTTTVIIIIIILTIALVIIVVVILFIIIIVIIRIVVIIVISILLDSETTIESAEAFVSQRTGFPESTAQ